MKPRMVTFGVAPSCEMCEKCFLLFLMLKRLQLCCEPLVKRCCAYEAHACFRGLFFVVFVFVVFFLSLCSTRS